jgi:hypothetical protein
MSSTSPAADPLVSPAADLGRALRGVKREIADVAPTAMPTTADMCQEAFLSLKDRAGSSRQAIKTYILAKYGKEPTAKALTAALAKDIFIKDKGTFKLTPAAPAPAAASTAAAPKVKKASKKKKAFVKVLDAKPLKLKLNNMIKRLAKMVDDDWHDGYEEQGETINEYLDALQAPLQQVIDVCVSNREPVDKREFVEANEILKAVADTFANMHTVPMRGGIEDAVANSDADFTLPGRGGDELSGAEDAFQYVWARLVRAAARGAATDTQINRMIKDAVDNGASVQSDDDDEDDDEGAAAAATSSNERLDRLYYVGEWRSLKTTKKKRKMRRAIDRRFDGDPARRTRDYHLFGGGFGGFGGFGGYGGHGYDDY